MCDFIYPTKYVSNDNINNLIYRCWYNDYPSVSELRLAFLLVLQQHQKNESEILKNV